MKKVIFLTLLSLLSVIYSRSQGCIVVRGLSGFGQYNPVDRSYVVSDWLINVNNRYFSTSHVYVGTHDQHVPIDNQSVNHNFSTEIDVTRILNNGWSLGFSLPFAANSRTSAVEHGGVGTPSHTTHAVGVGDISLTVYKWLWKPAANQKGNIQLGLGFKFPTGAFAYQDFYYKNDSTRILAPVNLSIQLGDGGTGFITELNSFYFLSNSFGLYGNFYYLINPRDQNGVSPLLGVTPTAIQLRTGGNVTSVPDQYSIRAGFNYIVKQFVFSAGLRDEGVPVYDLVGGSEGVRRPGYNVSIEPGITYNMKNVSIYGYVPIFIKHTILQGVPDREVKELTGVDITGGGGSGDWMIFLGFMVKL
jgi:hypothetical protein